MGAGASGLCDPVMSLGDVGAPFDQWCGPGGDLTLIHAVRPLRSEPDRLRGHCRDNAIGRPLYEVPDQGPAMQKPSTMNLSIPR